MPGELWSRLVRLTVLSVFLLGGALVGLWAQSDQITSSAKFLWGEGRWELTLSCPLSVVPTTDPDAVAPRQQYQAEQYLEDHRRQELLRRLMVVRLNSTESVAQAMKQDPELGPRVDQLNSELKFVFSRLDASGQVLTMRWSLNLWKDLAQLLPPIEQPNPLKRLLGWNPSRPFSGIVIYAMSPLPWRGTGTTIRWEPSLSPRFMNEEGQTLFDRSQMDPSYLAKWGTAAFQESRFNERRFQDRIGLDPLRIVARGVWGKRPNDLILADSDWDRILSLQANRRLLRQGRLLILWGIPKYLEEPQEGPPAPLPDRDNIPLVRVIPQPAPPGPVTTPK